LAWGGHVHGATDHCSSTEGSEAVLWTETATEEGFAADCGYDAPLDSFFDFAADCGYDAPLDSFFDFAADCGYDDGTEKSSDPLHSFLDFDLSFIYPKN
jgi:hypothetical protein